MLHYVFLFESVYDKTNNITCASSECSDQHVHLTSLTRVFAVWLKNHMTRLCDFPTHEYMQFTFKLRNYKWCSVSSLIIKRLAKDLISLRVCAGWSEPLLFAHTTLLETSFHSSWQSKPLSDLIICQADLGTCFILLVFVMHFSNKLGLDVRKPFLWGLRLGKAQTSLLNNRD